MLKKMLSVLTVITFALSLPGCGIIKTQSAIRGHNIASGDVNSIQKGTSTEKDILKLFGPPTKVRDTEEGKEYFYEYAKTGGFQWNLVFSIGGSTTVKTLIVWLDKKGVVTDYAFKKS